MGRAHTQKKIQHPAIEKSCHDEDRLPQKVLPPEQLDGLLRNLGDLPRAAEHWLGGWRSFDANEGGTRMAAVVWMDRESRLVRSCNMVEEQTAMQALVLELFAAMGDPLPGCCGCLPTQLSVPNEGMRALLAEALGPLGITVDVVSPEELEDALADVASTLAYGDMAYLHIPGIRPEQVGRFFEHASTLWRRALAQNTSPLKLFTISGMSPFPVIVSMSQQQGEALVRIYLAHLDHVICDILQLPTSKGLHVLLLTFAREGEIQAAFFEEARRHGWRIPEPDLVPLLSVADHADGLKPPDAADFDMAADVLEAILLWDGRSALDGRQTRVLSNGRRIQLAWPVHVPLPT